MPSSRHFHRPRRSRGRPPEPTRFTPSADPRLKRVFARIGVPEPAPFTPDPFQLEALAAVAASDCLVTAPTGSGKTWIAEQAIERIRAAGGRAWYACPLKALSNAKHAEFSMRFGADAVGILTGDRKENPDAPIIVGTTEILRNQLYDAMHRGESLNTDLVVIDEAHYLGDLDRGVVWEEVLIYLPARVPLLLLSATIGNAKEIAAWLASIRGRPCTVVAETNRPVPIFPLYLHPAGMLLPLSAPGRKGSGGIDQKVIEAMEKSRRFSHRDGTPHFGRIVELLRRYDLLPVIFFLKSRADCDRALDLCRSNRVDDPDRLQRLKARIDELAAQNPRMALHRQLPHLERLAVGAHHSGQLPFWKLVLEQLMTEGLLDAVFATTTVAAGVNFPARTIGLLNSDRFNGTQFLPLDPTEFHQMTGRAGRRGMDEIGFALIVPGRYMDVRRVHKLLTAPASEVESRIRINFSMVLNLLLSHPPARVQEMLQRSFAAWRRGRQPQGLGGAAAGLWRDFVRHLQFLRRKGYVNERDELTEEGRWASQLRVDQPLLIAEGFRAGVFPQGHPALLAAITAAFVNEKESDEELDPRLLPKALVKSYRQAADVLSPFIAEMTGEGFEARPLYLKPAAVLFTWANGRPWEQVAAAAEMEEGDLAMLILRTADNLRHIRALDRVFPAAASSAARAIELILREPVVEG
ncbi:MAG: DEAD/DEAH box helicase [Desulfobacterales bacterium]